MKIIITLFFALVFSAGQACGQSTLLKMSKSEDKDSVQTFFSFDQVPKYETQVNGKRLDIILHQTIIDETAPFFEEDDKIVKILVRPIKEDTELSFFFRYSPQKITFSMSENNTLVANIHLGNRFTRTYKDLSSSLSGVTVLDRSTQDFANPLVASPYAHDWKTFFISYESPVSVRAPVHFFIPEFPAFRILNQNNYQMEQLLPENVFVLAEQEKWHEIIPFIEQEINSYTDFEIKKILALTYGEILLRNGNFDGAYKQLYLLKNNYSSEQLGRLASYLLSMLLAVNDDPYSANYELRLLIDRMKNENPLFPYINLSLAETALATGQIELLSFSASRDDIGYPKELEPKRELRQADLFYASGHPIKAFVAYQLVSKDNDLNNHPYSLNGLCGTLYDQKSYQDSATCYNNLAERINTRDQLGMSYFRSAMAQLKSTEDYDELISDFSRIEDAFPGTEAGFRAAVKKTDLRYLSRKDWSATAIKYYHALAEKSIYREVSAESYFKEALLYHFAGDNSTSIMLTRALMRNFRSTPIRSSAEALLIQLLPLEIKKLVENKNYTAALALARQHRSFFENNWLDISLLGDLAFSYHQLGIYNDALQLYLYLMELARSPEKEQYFLPITQVAYDKRDYKLVQDYATQYDYHYPNGTFEGEILFLRLKSLMDENHIDRAISLIPEPLPEQDKYKLLAAALYYRNDNYPQVISILKPFWDNNLTLPDDLTFILAESLYLNDRTGESKPVYEKSKQVERYSGHSLYRLAEIARINGNEDRAIDLYTAMTQHEEETLWKKFAERELSFNRLSKNL